MASFEISDDERQVVLETLERTLSDLSVEIADTDQQDFREGLKHRRAVLGSVVEKLRRPDQVGSDRP